jgi:subtilisin family serine protease
MKKQIVRTAVCALVLLMSAQITYADNRFILHASAASIPDILVRHGLTLVSPPDAHNLAIVAQSDVRTQDQVLAEVEQDPDVQEVETQSTALVPESLNSPKLAQSTAAILDALAGTTPVSYFGGSAWSSYVNQPTGVLIRLGDTLKMLATGTSIVAVLDTGVDPNHPVLRGSLVPGYDFVNGIAGTASEWSDLNAVTAGTLSSSGAGTTNAAIQVNQSTAAILDQSTAAILDTTQIPTAFGHGTMVAGIIHLVAPTAQIMPLKVFHADGTGNLSDIVRAIYYAVDNGARVINMSFSMRSTSVALAQAIDYATQNNVICISSVGNEGLETLRYPAAYRNVIGVASTDSTDARSVFSNYGEVLVDIAAPGEGLVTVYPGGYYAVVSGTSFSAPLVSGAAALMLQNDVTLNQGKASRDLSNAKKLPTDDLGFGRLDLFQAVSASK